jgi:hypothetical protein
MIRYPSTKGHQQAFQPLDSELGPFGNQQELKSLHDQGAPSLLMEIIEKLVPAGREWPNIHDALAAGDHHLLHSQRHAFKFHGSSIKVLHPKRQRMISGRVDFRRLKMMALDCDRDRTGLLRVRTGSDGQKNCPKNQHSYDQTNAREIFPH